MAADYKLIHSVDKGSLLTYGMIDHDEQSCLWQLRREQDELFGMPGHK
jgi:predicted homoserine dehydrogenase-like protein